MKKNLKLKLSFEKHVIANLTDAQINKIWGGETADCTSETDTSVKYSRMGHCTVNPTLKPPTRY